MKKTLMIMLVLMFGISFMGISSSIAGDDCGCPPPGVGSPGYWMNHPDAWPLDYIVICPNGDDDLEVGYTRDEAIELMEAATRGDKWLTLFPAYVAAELNIALGNPRPEDCCRFEVRDWLCANLDGVRANSEAWQGDGEDFYFCLDAYNNGYQDGAPSRDALE